MNEPTSLLPYIASSLIAAAVVVLGWFVTSLLNRREARRLHRERRDDMQKAIYAEIRAFVSLQNRNDLEQHRMNLVNNIQNNNLTPFVIAEEHDRVYQALVGDIHYLPKETIDDVTIFYHSIAQISKMQDAMSGERFKALEQERRARIYDDYIATLQTALVQGREALKVIRKFDDEGRDAVEEYKSALRKNAKEAQNLETKAWVKENYNPTSNAGADA